MSKQHNEPPKFTTIGDIQEMTFVDASWIWDGVLRTGGGRPNIAIGKSGAGKSTWLRNLIAKVVRGESFFGRDTKKSAVFYMPCEDSHRDLKMFFDLLGYNRQTDAAIYTPDKYAPYNLTTLGAALRDFRDVGLVCVESMNRLLGVNDYLDNAKVDAGFIHLMQVLEPYAEHQSFLGLCHLRKNISDDIQDSILGATAYAAQSDAKIYYQAGPTGENRIISAKVRWGRDIPKTMVNIDKETQRLSLGPTFSEIKNDEFNQTQQTIKDAILQHLLENPGTTREDTIRAVKGKVTRRHDAFNELERAGVLEKKGKGTKGSPAKYSVKAIPVDGVDEAPLVEVAA